MQGMAIGLHCWLQLKCMRWVATRAALEKGKKPKCHHSLFLLWWSRMPLQLWEDHGLVTSPHLALSQACCPLRGADVVRDDFAEPWRQWQGSSVVFREGCESEVWLRKGCARKLAHRRRAEWWGREEHLCLALSHDNSNQQWSPTIPPAPLGWLSPDRGGKPDPLLVKSSSFGSPVSSPKNLSKWEGRGK